MSLSPTRLGANATGLLGPAPLPPISAALSRRAALFGVVTVAGVSAAAALPAMAGITTALSANDRRLGAIAADLVALQAEVDAYRGDDAGFGRLLDRFDPLKVEMEATAADTLDGVLHKIRSADIPGVGDDGQAHDLMCSICEDVVRLHGAGLVATQARLQAEGALS